MNFKQLITVFIALLIAGQTSAHNRWVLPSHFNLSNDKGEWIMVDVTASNETFSVDKPLGAEKLRVIRPNGNIVYPDSGYRGHRKSVVDIHLTDSGTYTLQMAGEPSYWTSYKLPGEDKSKWMQANKADRKTKLPKEAHSIVTRSSSTNIVTYVTLNSPSDNFIFKNEGLELKPITHPSDIAQGEKAEFTLLFNGKAQADIEVEITREGVRYRNEPQPLKLTSNKQGVISFTLAQAGRYLLIANHSTAVKDNPLTDKMAGKLFWTFETALN